MSDHTRQNISQVVMGLILAGVIWVAGTSTSILQRQTAIEVKVELLMKQTEKIENLSDRITKLESK